MAPNSKSEPALTRPDQRDSPQTAELASVHRQLHAVIDAMTEGLNIADMNGNLLLVNPRGAEMLGFTTPEEYAKTLPEFIGTFEVFSSEDDRLPFEQWPLNKLLHGEAVRDYVVTIHRLDTDRYVTLSHNGSIIYDEKGDPLYAVLTYRDVTEQMQTQKALQRKEQELRAAQRVARVGSWYWDAQTDKVTVSDQIYELYGLDPAKPYPSLKEQKGTLLPLRSWELVNSALAHTLRTGELYELEFELNYGKGGTIWIASRGEAVRNSEGKRIGLRGIVQDITARKQAEEALRFSEDKYRTLFNSMDEGFFLIDVLFDDEDHPVDLLYIEANAFATQIVGRDYTGKRLTELSPDYERYWFEIFGEVARTGKSVRLERYAEPDKKWYSFYVFKIGGPESRRIGNTFQDITARKQAEEALRRQAQLIDLTPDAIMVRALDGTIRLWSKGAEALYGWTAEEALGRKSHDLFKTSSSRPLEEIIKETLAEGRWSGELHHTAKDGRRVIVQSRWMVQCDGAGSVAGILESNVDVTEAKRAELTLRESEGRFRTMADSTPVMIWVTNASGEIEFVNHAYEEFFGVTEAQAKSTGSWSIGVHPEDIERYASAYAKALELHGPFDAQARVKHRSGEWRWVHSYGLPRISAHGEFLGHVGSSHDITAQRHAADALRASVENLRLMVNHASEAMMVIDGDGRIEAVSSLASRLLGYEEGELAGKAISQFAETFSRLEASLTLDNLRKGAPLPMTSSLRVRIKDGSTHWMSVTGHIVNLGMQGEKYFVKIQKLELPASRGSNPLGDKR